jgi:nitroreductase
MLGPSRFPLESVFYSERWGNPYKRIAFRKDQELKDFMADVSKQGASELFGSAPYELTQGRLWYVPDHNRPATFEDMRLGDLFAYPKDADVVIIGCGSETFHDSPLIYELEYFGAIVVAMGILNMWYAAHALGYGAGYQALPVMEPRRCELLCDKIGIPRSWIPLATLSIGVPKKPRMLYWCPEKTAHVRPFPVPVRVSVLQ